MQCSRAGSNGKRKMLGSAPAINLLSSSIIRSRDKRRKRKIPIAGIARPFPLSNHAAAEHQRAIKQLLLLSKGIRERRSNYDGNFLRYSKRKGVFSLLSSSMCRVCVERCGNLSDPLAPTFPPPPPLSHFWRDSRVRGRDSLGARDFKRGAIFTFYNLGKEIRDANAPLAISSPPPPSTKYQIKKSGTERL